MHYLTLLLTAIPAVGLLLNIFLFYVIWTNRRVASAYSGFLMISTIYTFCYALGTMTVDPMFVNDNHGYTIFSLRLVTFGAEWSRYGAIAQNLIFCAGFVFSFVHTLYRYCTITGKMSFIFDTKLGLFFVIFSPIAFSALWLFMIIATQEPTVERLGDRARMIYEMFQVNLTTDGFTGGQFWDTDGIRWLDLNGALALSFMSGIIFQLNVFITWKLHGHVKTVVCSQATREAQAQLVAILTAQLCVTCITEIIPCTMVIWGGFLGLSSLCPYSPVIANLFPTFNVCIIVLLVKAFRLRTLEIFSFCIKIKAKETFHSAYSITSINPFVVDKGNAPQ